MDERAVSGRTEKQFPCLCAERFVLRCNCNCVSGFVLICELHGILHSITLLIQRLNLFKSSLEKCPMLRRNSHHEIGAAVSIPHIVLSLNEMLRKCSSGFALVFMEFQHALRFGSIAQSLVGKSLGKDVAAACRSAFRFAEQRFVIEGELFDCSHEFRSRGVICNSLTSRKFLKSAEKVLEHTGSGSGCRYEFAFAVHLSRFHIGRSLFQLFFVQHLDSVSRNCRTFNIHPREACLEAFHLCLDCCCGCAACLNLFQIFVV